MHGVKTVIYGHLFRQADLDDFPDLWAAASACERMRMMRPGDFISPSLGTGYDGGGKLFWIGAVRADGYNDTLLAAAMSISGPEGTEQARLAHVLDACPPRLRESFLRFPAVVACFCQTRACTNEVMIRMDSEVLTQVGDARRCAGSAVPQEWLDGRGDRDRSPYLLSFTRLRR